MKLKELIEKLQEVEKKHGNIDCTYEDCSQGIVLLENIVVLGSSDYFRPYEKVTDKIVNFG